MDCCTAAARLLLACCPVASHDVLAGSLPHTALIGKAADAGVLPTGASNWLFIPLSCSDKTGTRKVQSTCPAHSANWVSVQGHEVVTCRCSDLAGATYLTRMPLCWVFLIELCAVVSSSPSLHVMHSTVAPLGHPV